MTTKNNKKNENGMAEVKKNKLMASLQAIKYQWTQSFLDEFKGQDQLKFALFVLWKIFPHSY